jgi:hypothetical protein
VPEEHEFTTVVWLEREDPEAPATVVELSGSGAVVVANFTL